MTEQKFTLTGLRSSKSILVDGTSSTDTSFAPFFVSDKSLDKGSSLPVGCLMLKTDGMVCFVNRFCIVKYLLV